jgi:hypothetical protein
MVAFVGLLYIRKGISKIEKSVRRFKMHGGGPVSGWIEKPAYRLMITERSRAFLSMLVAT